MMILFDSFLSGTKEWQEIKDLYSRNLWPLSVTGLTDQAKAQFTAFLCAQKSGRAMVVCDSDYTARLFCEDLPFFLGREGIYYPSKEIEYYRVDARSHEMEAQRLSALGRLLDEENGVLVLGVDALLQFAADYGSFAQSKLSLSSGESIPTEDLISKLDAMGYIREDMVESKGQFSVRGGIVDVYPPGAENPYRIEFFGDDIDSIREFDPIMQTSIETLSQIRIEAARELCGNDENPCVADWLSENDMVIFNEPERIRERAEGYLWDIGETVSALLEKGVIEEAKEAYIHDYQKVLSKLLTHPFVGLFTLPQSTRDYHPRQSVTLTSHGNNMYSGRRELFYEDLKNWLQQKYAVVISAGTKAQQEALLSELSDHGFPVYLAGSESKPTCGQVEIIEGSLKKGFSYPGAKLVLLSDQEIFGRETRRAKRRKVAKGNQLKSFDDLDVGDYVVHATHGIGQYMGLDTLPVRDITKTISKFSTPERTICMSPAT
ncbi:MAG: hypothetical protein IJO50_01740, partial [Clostridia bacterium]|nr:hypothetical protein [Clostridia bacterium]